MGCCLLCTVGGVTSLVTVESSCTHTRGVINVSDQCGTFIQPFSYIVRWPIHIGLPMYIPGEGSLIGGLDISMCFMSLMHEKTFASSFWTTGMPSAIIFALFHASQGVSALATSHLNSPFPIRLKWSATDTLEYSLQRCSLGIYAAH